MTPMICEIVSHAVELHGFERGRHTVHHFCQTHLWDLSSGPISDPLLCPIGRIEQARDEAIAAIRNERNNATHDDGAPPL